MSEKNIYEMTWYEIPSDTPLYEVLQGVGFPDPMIILKHLNQPKKSGKAPDLSGIVSLLWMPFGDIREVVESLYSSASRNTEVRQYLIKHPEQALLLFKARQQLQKEPISVVVERNLNQWRTLLIEEGVWKNLMKETPLTIIEKIAKMFSDTDYLNMTLGEYYEKFGAEETFEKLSIKSLGDKIAEKERRERQMKELAEMLRSGAFRNFTGRHPFDDESDSHDKFTS